MTALVRLPTPKPIEIVIPPALCETPDCLNARQFDMVLLLMSQSSLQVIQVCGLHAFLWKGWAPANFFPLNNAPSLEWMASEVEKEIVRRRPPAVQYRVSYGFGTATSTGNTYWGGFQ